MYIKCIVWIVVYDMSKTCTLLLVWRKNTLDTLSVWIIRDSQTYNDCVSQFTYFHAYTCHFECNTQYLDGILKEVQMLSVLRCTILTLNDRHLGYVTEAAKTANLLSVDWRRACHPCWWKSKHALVFNRGAKKAGRYFFGRWCDNAGSKVTPFPVSALLSQHDRNYMCTKSVLRISVLTLVCGLRHSAKCHSQELLINQSNVALWVMKATKKWK